MAHNGVDCVKKLQDKINFNLNVSQDIYGQSLKQQLSFSF